MNQIDIPDYQYYLGCNAKRMVRLTFLEKNRNSIENIDLFAYSIFKNIEIFWVKELFKSDKTRYGVSPVQSESKTEKKIRIICLGRKLVFHTVICDYFHGNNRKFPYEKLTFFLDKL